MYVALAAFGANELYTTTRHLVRLWVLYDHFPHRFPRARTPAASLNTALDKTFLAEILEYVTWVAEGKIRRKKAKKRLRQQIALGQARGGGDATTCNNAFAYDDSDDETPAAGNLNPAIRRIWAGSSYKVDGRGLVERQTYKKSIIEAIMAAHGLEVLEATGAAMPSGEGTVEEVCGLAALLDGAGVTSPRPYCYLSEVISMQPEHRRRGGAAPNTVAVDTDETQVTGGEVLPDGRQNRYVHAASASRDTHREHSKRLSTCMGRGINGREVLTSDCRRQSGAESVGLLGKKKLSTESSCASMVHAQPSVGPLRRVLSCEIDGGSSPLLDADSVCTEMQPMVDGSFAAMPFAVHSRREATLSANGAAHAVTLDTPSTLPPTQTSIHEVAAKEARRELRRLERSAAAIAALYERAVFDYYALLEDQHARRKAALVAEERAKRAWLVHALEHPEDVLVPIPRHMYTEYGDNRSDASGRVSSPVTAEDVHHTVPHYCVAQRLHAPGAVLSRGFLASIRPTMRADVARSRAAWRWQLAMTLLRYPQVRRERKHYLRTNGFTPKLPLVFDPTGV